MTRKTATRELPSWLDGPTPLERAQASEPIADCDLLRIKVLARLYARGLPPAYAWMDLVQEAFARTLDGRRRRPPEVPLVAFIAGVMRSLRSEVWARHERGELLQLRRVMPEMRGQESGPCPEQRLIAIETLEQIEALFAGDAEALRVIDALAEGLTAEEVRVQCELTPTAYATVRKRIRRALLRAGLTWGEV